VPASDVTIRPLAEADLDAADRVMRVAFGTFVGLPDPAAFLGDGRYVHHRFRVDPASAFVALADGEVVGSNFATRWGSFGYFGPLSIRPDLWDRGIGRRLMEPQGDRNGVLEAAFDVTDALWDGLDVGDEIATIDAQGLGDTALVWDGPTLVAFAACHPGAETEAGSGRCYVRFGAARPGLDAERRFAALMGAVSALAASRGVTTIAAGVNTARHETYEWMLNHGFRTEILGVAMQRPNEPAFSRPGVWVSDDWR
jgi:hypothetical protein